MRFFILALVLVFLLTGVIAYFGARFNDLDRVTSARATPGGPAAVAETHDFKALSTLLQAEMTKIPQTVAEPRQVPVHAFDIKARLEGAVQTHEEYAVIKQVCDLIIYADQEHSVRQRECGMEQGKAYTSTLDVPSDSKRATIETAERTQIYQKNQELWENYRKQSEGEVKRLLATLDGKQL